MSKGEETRRKILETAASQASVRGLLAVSLSDVAGATGLSKSGVFKHFQAKEALHQALLEQVMATFTERVWLPVKPLPRGRERLEAVFEHWLDWVGDQDSIGGCGLTAFSIELDDQPGPLRDLLKSQQLRWHATLALQFAALTDPPLAEAQANQAAFEMKSIVLGYGHSRRLLDDESARGMAKAAFRALLERLA